MTRKQAILKRLLSGPAALYELRDPDIGGCAADVRIRELRRLHNIPIKFYYKTDKEGKKTNTSVYYLACQSKDVDLDNICMRENYQLQLGI